MNKVHAVEVVVDEELEHERNVCLVRLKRPVHDSTTQKQFRKLLDSVRVVEVDLEKFLLVLMVSVKRLSAHNHDAKHVLVRGGGTSPKCDIKSFIDRVCHSVQKEIQGGIFSIVTSFIFVATKLSFEVPFKGDVEIRENAMDVEQSFLAKWRRPVNTDDRDLLDPRVESEVGVGRVKAW